jgi:single-strand DNA-binding protein
MLLTGLTMATVYQKSFAERDSHTFALLVLFLWQKIFITRNFRFACFFGFSLVVSRRSVNPDKKERLLMSFNRIILVGNLGRDPELRYTAQGTPVCSFSMATNERRKDKSGEMQDHTTWFRITLWNRLAETASQYLQKGKQVYIEGRLRVEEYIDRDGKPRHSLEVFATDMQFIGSRGGDEPMPERAASAGASTAGAPESQADLSDDDIPF